ncbi:hypothetical protein CHELA40_13216 [Chelatococcus asaccharovorans]|nr:hypothetical protein CHELA40_13216 [Chelatococcus asaccharovorans]CAH1679579.1 hypothetical protein CHELA17_62404 [Chelatococcus asaccharovorans]
MGDLTTTKYRHLRSRGPLGRLGAAGWNPFMTPAPGNFKRDFADGRVALAAGTGGRDVLGVTNSDSMLMRRKPHRPPVALS